MGTRYSELRSSSRPSLASRLPLEAPLAVYLETTNRCNFACTMCPVSFDDYEEVVGGITSLPLAVIETLFRDLRAMGHVAALKLYGEGEPLLNKDLPDIVRLAKELNVADRIEITSNGSALTPAVGAKLIAAKLDYLRISVYGVDEEEQRTVTQSKVSAARIRQNVSDFRRQRDELGAVPFLYAKIIDTPGSPRATEFLRMYAPLVDEAAVEPAMNWNGYDDRALVRLEARAKTRSVCAFPFYSVVIKANGDVVACCVDWNKSTRFGNIHEQSFAEIWTGERLRDFRRMHLERRSAEHPSCRNWTFHETCPDDLDQVPSSAWARILG
jgi:radical SAM protein with 4Fe4S-binding SPASM domain